jgi:hypothetical protein
MVRRPPPAAAVLTGPMLAELLFDKTFHSNGSRRSTAAID